MSLVEVVQEFVNGLADVGPFSIERDVLVLLFRLDPPADVRRTVHQLPVPFAVAWRRYSIPSRLARSQVRQVEHDGTGSLAAPIILAIYGKLPTQGQLSAEREGDALPAHQPG